uniref:Endonuclease/exonuclease/phosphatase domain-containing protein n=1 Tax=Bracon brevicornis TaxID=1563983 RepID=A0A6V7L8W1_9HYME
MRSSEQYLIVTDAKERSSVAIAGDFNAWTVEWGSKKTNWRGQSHLEAFAVLDLQLLNDGELSTFIQEECTSMIDLTFTSSSLARGNCNWEVSDIITLSDSAVITALLLGIRRDNCDRYRCQHRERKPLDVEPILLMQKHFVYVWKVVVLKDQQQKRRWRMSCMNCKSVRHCDALTTKGEPAPTRILVVRGHQQAQSREPSSKAASTEGQREAMLLATGSRVQKDSK